MPTWTDYDDLTAPAPDDTAIVYDTTASACKEVKLAYIPQAHVGTAFPTENLYDGYPFHRTDIYTGLDCYYDLTNTQWLTANEYSIPYVLGAISSTVSGTFRIRADYQPYFTYFAATTTVATTNNGTHHWDITVLSGTVALASFATITTISTTADTATVVTDHSEVFDTHTNADYGGLRFTFTKVDTPGNLTFQGCVYYRLIIT